MKTPRVLAAGGISYIGLWMVRVFIHEVSHGRRA